VKAVGQGYTSALLLGGIAESQGRGYGYVSLLQGESEEMGTEIYHRNISTL